MKSQNPHETLIDRGKTDDEKIDRYAHTEKAVSSLVNELKPKRPQREEINIKCQINIVGILSNDSVITRLWV